MIHLMIAAVYGLVAIDLRKRDRLGAIMCAATSTGLFLIWWNE